MTIHAPQGPQGASRRCILKRYRMRYHQGPKAVFDVSKLMQFAIQRSTIARRRGRRLVAACCWALRCWGYRRRCMSCRRMLSEWFHELPACLYILDHGNDSLKKSIDVQFSYMQPTRSSRHGIPADVLVGQMQSSSVNDSHSASMQDAYERSTIEKFLHLYAHVTYAAIRQGHDWLLKKMWMDMVESVLGVVVGCRAS